MASCLLWNPVWYQRSWYRKKPPKPKWWRNHRSHWRISLPRSTWSVWNVARKCARYAHICANPMICHRKNIISNLALTPKDILWCARSIHQNAIRWPRIEDLDQKEVERRCRRQIRLHLKYKIRVLATQHIRISPLKFSTKGGWVNGLAVFENVFFKLSRWLIGINAADNIRLTGR